MVKPSDTRWLAFERCIKVVKENYCAIVISFIFFFNCYLIREATHQQRLFFSYTLHTTYNIHMHTIISIGKYKTIVTKMSLNNCSGIESKLWSYIYRLAKHST